MSVTRKVLRKVAAVVEGTPGTYEAPDVLLPYTSFIPKQTFEPIADESIVGVAFQDIPLQGIQKVEGALAGQVEVNTIEQILEAAFGAKSTLTFTLPTDKNEKSLSINCIDGVKTNKYAGVYIKGLTISSSAGQRVLYNAGLVGWKAVTRDDTEFPSINTNPAVGLIHHNAGGTGYIRIADQADALDSGDNIGLDNWEVSVNWNFDSQHDNTQQYSLQPLSGAGGRPTAGFKFRVSRHSADTLLAARDNWTAMQAEIYLYRSATATMKIQIPNFVISDAGITEDDVGGIDIETTVGRNGLGANYSNSNMSFVSPVKIIVVNS